MNDQLRADAEHRPRVFRWYGPVDREAIERWLRQRHVAVPDELVDLWVWTGGGLIFDSEDILRPVLGSEVEDSVEARTEWYRGLGLPQQYLLFQEGLFLSAVRQPDGVVVELDPDTFQEVQTFDSLSEWYLRTLRREFASRYGLPLLGGEPAHHQQPGPLL